MRITMIVAVLMVLVGSTVMVFTARVSLGHLAGAVVAAVGLAFIVTAASFANVLRDR